MAATYFSENISPITRIILGVITGAVLLVGLTVPLDAYSESYSKLIKQSAAKTSSANGDDCVKCPAKDVKKSDPDRLGHKIKKSPAKDPPKKTPPKKDPPKKSPKAIPKKR